MSIPQNLLGTLPFLQDATVNSREQGAAFIKQNIKQLVLKQLLPTLYTEQDIEDIEKETLSKSCVRLL